MAHQVYHSEEYHGLSVVGALFVVLGESSESPEPSEGAFDGPPLGVDGEPEVNVVGHETIRPDGKAMAFPVLLQESQVRAAVIFRLKNIRHAAGVVPRCVT